MHFSVLQVTAVYPSLGGGIFLNSSCTLNLLALDTAGVQPSFEQSAFFPFLRANAHEHCVKYEKTTWTTTFFLGNENDSGPLSLAVLNHFGNV